MTFTTIPPTTPGFYAWRADSGYSSECKELYDYKGEAFQFGGIYHGYSASKIGGEWCRLVPADEVEKAWDEGAKMHVNEEMVLQRNWMNSRAKRIAEGKE